MNRVALAFTVLALGSAASHAAPQQLTRCVAGQEVTDKEGKSGVIVADDSNTGFRGSPDVVELLGKRTMFGG